MSLRICIWFVFTGLISSAASIQDATTSASFSQLNVDAGVLSALATSSVCVADQARTTILGAGPVGGGKTTTACTFAVRKTNYTGAGFPNIAKFGPNDTVISNSFAGIANYNPNLNPNEFIASQSSAGVNPFVSPTPTAITYGAQFSISGSITSAGYLFLGTVSAAAQASDPEIFDFTAPGTHFLNFTYGLGVNQGGSSVPQLSLLSVDPIGENEIDISASFGNTSYKGQSLNGDLFSLTIGADGIINSPSDLSIVFTPWQGLDLTLAQIAGVENGIRNDLAVTSDGSVGLAPGTSLDIFGDDPGALLPAIDFDSPSGIVTYDDSAALVSTETPEPNSLTLTFAAILCGQALLWRKPHRDAAASCQELLAGRSDAK